MSAHSWIGLVVLVAFNLVAIGSVIPDSVAWLETWRALNRVQRYRLCLILFTLLVLDVALFLVVIL